MSDSIKSSIIKYLENNGESSKGKLDDYMRDLRGTLGETTARRLRELCKSGIIERVWKEYGDKKYLAYRIAEVKVPIVGIIKDEKVIFKEPNLKLW